MSTILCVMLDYYYLIDVTLHTEAKPRQAILIKGLGRSVEGCRVCWKKLVKE